jgi:hypothetical protein
MTKLTKAQFTKKMKTIKVPAGFTAEFKTESWGFIATKENVHETFVLVKPDDTKITFDQSGSGHVEYKANGKWYTFDRRGVEDSFYFIALWKGDTSGKKDLNVLVADQLKRIEAKREYHATAIPVPGLPFTVAPDGVEKLKKQLQTMRTIHFTPSGFGTGYAVSKLRSGYRYGEKRASPELEQFLGHAPLYITTMDCD